MLNTKRLLHIIFIFYFLFSVPVTSYSQNSNRVVCNNEQITIINLIKKIEKQTEYTFVFDNTIHLSNVVNIKAGTYKVETLLDQAFGKNGITYQFVEKQILLKKAVVKQPRRLSGVVVDDQGKPIIGATVKIKKTGVGTITNVNGEFTLSVVDNAALEVSYIGYETKHFVVNNHSKIQIVLKEDVKTDRKSVV